MNDQGNPFLYGRPVEQAEELIDREGERAELQGSGALKSALDGLAASGYLERKRTGARPEQSEPLLALRIRERMNGS